MADASVVTELGLGVAYTVLGGIMGMTFLSLAAHVIPKIVDKMTPAIDDEKELVKGNVAMGIYSGIITGAVIIGACIIIAASIIAGLM
jgi:hypothetical protein